MMPFMIAAFAIQDSLALIQFKTVSSHRWFQIQLDTSTIEDQIAVERGDKASIQHREELHS